jgi:hypothetical protein
MRCCKRQIKSLTIESKNTEARLALTGGYRRSAILYRASFLPGEATRLGYDPVLIIYD